MAIEHACRYSACRTNIFGGRCCTDQGNNAYERHRKEARGLWLTDEVELARPEVLGGTREFAHIHPDGSLHVWLPAERAIEVEQTKWGELHPWVDREGFWDGVVMVYTPETQAELDVTIRLIVDAYNYATGADLDPESY